MADFFFLTVAVARRGNVAAQFCIYQKARKAPSFRSGMDSASSPKGGGLIWCSLLFDVFPDDFNWRSSTASSKV